MATSGFVFVIINDYNILMRQALRLASKGRGLVSPNPRVGALVIDRNGELIGEGYHRRHGGDHAEIAALAACEGRDLHGATMVVTLEPCCFQGKTPACTKAILNAGIAKVVAAVKDPNPLVNGAGFAELTRAGISVENGVLESEARYQNRGYFSYFERGRAWCAAKIALSLDGKMADPAGRSKWITGPEARRLAHQLRADHDAVLVGAQTVIADDPELNVRHVHGPNPARIILAPHRGIPESAKIAHTAAKLRTILVSSDLEKPQGAGLAGVEVVRLRGDRNGHINPRELLAVLPHYGILSVLIEGGSASLSAFMQAGVIDEVSIAYAPSVIGKGLAPFDSFVPDTWDLRPQFIPTKHRQLGDDLVVTYYRKDARSLPA